MSLNILTYSSNYAKPPKWWRGGPQAEENTFNFEIIHSFVSFYSAQQQ